MPDWNEAIRVTLMGLAVVFGVMSIIAGATWLSGRAFIAAEARAKARKKAEKAKKKAEKEKKEKEAKTPEREEKADEAGDKEDEADSSDDKTAGGES